MHSDLFCGCYRSPVEKGHAMSLQIQIYAYKNILLFYKFFVKKYSKIPQQNTAKYLNEITMNL